jgi:hypothetical protein
MFEGTAEGQSLASMERPQHVALWQVSAFMEFLKRSDVVETPERRPKEKVNHMMSLYGFSTHYH